MINTVIHFFNLYSYYFWFVDTETNLSCSDSSSFLTVKRENIQNVLSRKLMLHMLDVQYIFKKIIKMLLHFLFKLVSTL